MLSPEDIKAEKHFLLGALLIVLILVAINYATGIFTRMHLDNEAEIALEHGVNSELYRQMVDELIGDLRSGTAWKRQLAAVELGHLGRGAIRAVPELKPLLHDKQKSVRTAGALALARIGSYTNEMVKPLMEILQGAEDHAKYLAVKALGRIGPEAKAAIPLLQRELRDGHAEVKAAARKALEKIQGQDNSA